MHHLYSDVQLFTHRGFPVIEIAHRNYYTPLSVQLLRKIGMCEYSTHSGTTPFFLELENNADITEGLRGAEMSEGRVEAAKKRAKLSINVEADRRESRRRSIQIR
jgi:hypothetical protein